MKLEHFIDKIKKDLDTFNINMINLDYNEQSLEEWMTTYLRWAEWTTDMHDICWKE